jgi:cyclophilin family peptidyl-prolyl cis-trans isomerase
MINPLKASSSTQFYIVQGKIFTLSQLSILEQKRNQAILNEKAKQFFESEQRQLNDTSKVNIKIYQDSALNKAKKYLKENSFSFTEEQKQAYTNLGGAPHLDGNYTVFGEVIQGIEIVDIIANLPTDQNDRPTEDVKFKIKIK